MATGTSRTARDILDKISKYHLECDICQERYKQPKILECLHSFCEHCLKKYYESKNKGAPNIECPSCRQKTILPEKGISGLKTNFHLIGLVDEITEQEKLAYAGNCEICDEGIEATHRCLDCAQNICSRCKKLHLRVVATLNHTIAILEDVRQGKVEVKKPDDMPKCHKHKGEVQRFYCKTCEKLICRDCTVVDHCKPDHHYIDSGDASVECKQSLKAIFPDFNTDIQGLEKSLQDTSQAKQEFKVKIVKTEKEVLERAAEVVAQVEIDKNRMIKQLRALEQRRIITFDEHDKTVTALLQRKQHSLAIAEQMTDTASDGNVLSLYPIIFRDLKLLQKSSNPGPIDRHKLLYLRFKHDRQGITLGKLQVTPMWELCQEFGMAGDSPGMFNGARGIAVSQGDEILVADCNNQRVVVCSIDGNHKGIIPVKADTHDVATSPNRFVVVGESKYVKIFNQDSTLAYEFPTVPKEEIDKTEVALTSVAVTKDGTILVGDSKRKVLTEHNPTDGSLKRTIPVQTSPHFLAVKDSDDRVMINGYKHIFGTSSDEIVLVCMMDALDRNGASKFAIKPTIDGEPVGHCGGAYWDSSGIYLAVSQRAVGTGHIHQYNAEGRFLSCLAQGLHHPQGITFTRDRKLVVADLFSVKMYHKV